jgi:hypothetical protein
MSDDRALIYGTRQEIKSLSLRDEILVLTEHHRKKCHEYESFLRAIEWKGATSLEELPYIPVRLFKELTLKSIPDEDIFRVLTSSGTTGNNVSKIYLDTEAATVQSQMMVKTMSEILGKTRLPMLVIDSKSVTAGNSFSARGAGILGMMNLGRKHCFALDDDLVLSEETVQAFLEEHGNSPFIIFGFTYMVWSNFAALENHTSLDLSAGTLVHSGGWKKLVDQAVDHQEFREQLFRRFGLSKIYNFYGMVEQIGTVFLESENGDGSLTCPTFADVIIRDPITLEPMPDGQVGIIQTLSTLPTSYPGHSILTEDLGVIEGIDDQSRLGKRFRVVGRLPRAEVRGCSDTFIES